MFIFKKLSLSSIIMILVFSLMVNLIPTKASAGPGFPFGGKVIKVIPCTCSANLLIATVPIGPTSPPFLIFGPSSILYQFYQIFRPGAYLLGNYGPPVPCLVYIGIGCIPMPLAPTAPLILMVGTSI